MCLSTTHGKAHLKTRLDATPATILLNHGFFLHPNGYGKG